jgi:hypothetical protein
MSHAVFHCSRMNSVLPKTIHAGANIVRDPVPE